MSECALCHDAAAGHDRVVPPDHECAEWQAEVACSDCVQKRHLTEPGWGVVWGARSFAEARRVHEVLELPLHDWCDALDKAAFFGGHPRLFWAASL